VSRPSGAAGVARSPNASAAHWINEIEEALRAEGSGGNREALLRTWRERFVEEIKYATSDEVSLADIAWGLAQPAPAGPPPAREAVVADLDHALLSRRWPVGLLEAVAHHVACPAVLSRASRLAWFLDNEARLTAVTGPAPYPPRDMSALWARLRRTPIDGTTAYAGNQICLREIAPVGLGLWHPRLSLTDALARVMPRHAAHRNIFALMLAAFGQRDIERACSLNRIVEKQFIKIPQAEKQQIVAVLLLQAQILRH
jgi:hypothetical protein